MARRLGFILFLIAIAAMPASMTYASVNGECLDPGLVYTGDLFDKFGATRLCAQVVCDPCACRPEPAFLGDACLYFQATDLWGNRRTNGEFTSVLTNAVGRVCDPQNFGPGVFEVQAFGCDGGRFDGVESPPVAVTVYNSAIDAGIAAGGAILLDSCKRFECPCETCRPEDHVVTSTPNRDGMNKCGCVETTCRRATFGLYYDVQKPDLGLDSLVGSNTLANNCEPFEFCCNVPLPDGRIEQLLFEDPCRPAAEGGPVKIEVTQFRTQTLPIFVHVSCDPFCFHVRFEGLKLTGYCKLTENGVTVTKYFEALLSNQFTILSKPPYFKVKQCTFCIKVWEYPNTTLYKACGKVVDGGSRIFLDQ